jgi:hypothetical protein
LSRLLAVNDPDGTWSAGPSAFFWDLRLERYRVAPAEEGRSWLWANWPEFSPEVMWQARSELGVDLTTLVICRNRGELEGCAFWFCIEDIDHIDFYPEAADEIDEGDAVEQGTGEAPPDTPPPNRRRRTPRPVLPQRMEPWLGFQDDEGPTPCLTTGDSVRGLHSVRRLQLIYTFCPSVTLLGETDMGSNNILICVSPNERRKAQRLPEGFQQWHDL